MKNLLIYLSVFVFWSCSMSSRKGQAVGFVTHFQRSGVFWKSWELELNSSQTGMTSTAKEVDLSIDNDNEDENIINILDSAQKYGWKIQVDYQQNFGTNCMNNRGDESAFVKRVEILDKNPLGGIKQSQEGPIHRNKDTIYVIQIKQ